jgi:hypothetical protein
MDIMAGLAALSQALTIAKELRQIEKGFNEAEFKLKVAELYSMLADAKVALADAKTEIEAREAEIKALTGQFQVRAATVEYEGYKYEQGPDGKPVGWPYCPICENEGRMVRTTYSGEVRGEGLCPYCKAVYRYVEDFAYPSR